MTTVNPGVVSSSVDNELSGINNLLSFVVWPATGQTATAFGIRDSATTPTRGVVFSGTGLTYGAGLFPTGGTITGYEVFDLPGGASAMVVAGITGLSAANLAAYIAAGDDAALIAAIFGGADTINGGDVDDYLLGYGGADVIHAGAGNDEIVAAGGVAGEVYDGGTGIDRLTVNDGAAAVINQLNGTVSDFTAAAITSIEQLAWDTTSINNAVFLSSQFGAGLSSSLALFGNGQANHLVVGMAAPGALDLSGLTFNAWNGNLTATGDQVIVTGTDGADTVTGTSQVDILIGDLTAAGGADVLHGGAGGDFLRGGAGLDQVYGDDGNDIISVNAGEWVAGELIDGGAGTDQLNVNGAFDFSLGSILSIERLMMQDGNGAPIASFSATQAASGLASNLTVVGSASDDTVAIVASGATTLDISGWTFSTWTAGDKLSFTGSGSADTLTISAINGAYAVTLGGGVDTLALAGTGGGFNASNAITINDFAAGAAGDKLELTNWLNSALQNYTPNSDPFASGHLRLTQNGADTLVQVDRDGAGANGAAFSTLMTLKNVNASTLTSINLDGYGSNLSAAGAVTVAWNSSTAAGVVDNGFDSIGSLATFTAWTGPGGTIAPSASYFAMKDPGNTLGIVFYGLNLGSYSGGYPNAGTITGYETFDLATGKSGMVATGFAVSASQFHTFILNGDSAGAQAAFYGGADSVTGSPNDDFLQGYGGADTIHAGAGNDEIVANGGVAGETYDGGTGTDRLTVDDGVAALIGQLNGTASNFSAATLTSIEQLAWQTTSINNAIFAGSQFGAGLSSNLALFGNGAPNHLVVSLASASVLNLSGLTFNNWNGNLTQTGDQVIVTGSDGADVITGTSQTDIITGDLTAAGGADTIRGGGGDDFLRGGVGADQVYGDDGNDIIGVNPGEAAAGELIDGGAGTDQLNLNGAIDLRGVIIASIERLTLQNAAGAASAILTATQVASGFASNLVVTATATNDVITIAGVAGQAADVSGWTLSGWSATDAVNFAGSSGADSFTLNTLVGTSSITLGAGADVVGLAGTGGQFRAAGAIVINDFAAGDGLDRLELSAWLNSALLNYGPNSDPFGAGHLRLTQSGADTLVEVDRDGASLNGAVFSTLLILKNVDAASLTTFNLDGFISNIPRPGPQSGSAGSDVLVGGAGADYLRGLDGADTLRGGGGSDILDGGAGIDTALYSGSSYSYAIAPRGTAVAGGPEGGADTLISVEKIRFVDGYFNTELGDTSAQVYRLYQTMLNRTPDANGLAFWTQQIDFKGASLLNVANGFIGSSEFMNLYGANTSNTQFVTLLYSNVLKRAPDPQGLDYWNGYLADGHARSEVVIGFSESVENINRTAVGIGQGVWVGDPNAGVAARFYDTVFSRLPDASGLDTWTKALNAGASLQSVANGFVASTEFQTTYGGLNNDQFIELMYHNVLGRGSDADGKTNWMNTLANGGTRADVVVGFSESAEHIRLLAPHIDDGVWVV